MRHLTFKRLAGAATLASALLIAGCSGDDGPDGDGTVKDYFSAVQAVVDVSVSSASLSAGRGATVKQPRASFSASAVPTVSFHSGTVPTGGGPTVSGGALSSPLEGEPLRFGITANAAFTTIYVTVVGATGYWQVDLGTSTTLAELVLTLNDNLPQQTFTVGTAVGTGGSAGTAFTSQLTATDLADADVSVVLKWTGASDVDLHVTDPKGQEVYWSNDHTAEGGRLNLDSNAACEIDNVNQEIISWPAGTAPTGTYSVRVDYYDDCGQNSAPYTVTINRKNHSATSTSGTFTGSSDNTQTAAAGTFTFP